MSKTATVRAAMSAPAANARPGGAQRKRKRVAFHDAAAATDDDDAAAREVAAARTQREKGANLDFLDDEEGSDEVVEEEDVAGRSATGGAHGEDEEEDDDEDGDGDKAAAAARRRRVLRSVKGESRSRLEEEYNDAGQAFEPFNLKAERDEGHFDEAGNYVAARKGADDHDPWLDELDAMAPTERQRLQATAASATGRRAAAAGGGSDDDDGDGDGGAVPESEPEDLSPAVRAGHLLVLYTHALTAEETVADALRRIGAASRAALRGAAKGAPRPQATLDFDAVTEAADALLTNGLVDVYALPRRRVLLELNDARDDAGLPALREASAVRAPGGGGGGGGAPAAAATAPAAAAASTGTAAAAPDAVTRRWEYRWGPPPASEAGGAAEPAAAAAATHGPFTSAEMAAWRAAGYFSAGAVFVRDTLAAPAAAMGAVAAPATTSSAADDDSDDIFGGVGRYVPPAVAAAGSDASWRPVDSVDFSAKLSLPSV